MRPYILFSSMFRSFEFLYSLYIYLRQDQSLFHKQLLFSIYSLADELIQQLILFLIINAIHV